LKNNDYTLLKAIYLAFETAYGKGGRIAPTPYLEERNGRNLIKFAGDNESYYVFPVKEDTGEIHTLLTLPIYEFDLCSCRFLVYPL
jgi:hypothetical protein